MTLMGLFVTADIVCSTMVMGLTIAGTISVILIASGRAGRKKQIAFTPSIFDPSSDTPYFPTLTYVSMCFESDIWLLNSTSAVATDTTDESFALKAKYKVKLPVSFFAVDGIWIEDYSNSRKWTGKNPGEKTDPYVFYTDYGSVYHLSEQCNYLDLSIKSIKWSQVGASRNKDGRKYHACYCAADKKTEGSMVFITDYGMNYHGKLGCSKLKRTVHKVHKSEVDGKNLCSKCKGEGT